MTDGTGLDLDALAALLVDDGIAETPVYVAMSDRDRAAAFNEHGPALIAAARERDRCASGWAEAFRIGVVHQERADKAEAEVAALREVSEFHAVHVTAQPVAEDVVWCDQCEEWVESGPPERHPNTLRKRAAALLGRFTHSEDCSAYHPDDRIADEDCDCWRSGLHAALATGGDQ